MSIPPEGAAGRETAERDRKPRPKTPLGRQILRIAVWSGVAVFGVVAAIELRAKQGAVSTAQAWQNALEERADANLSEADLAGMVSGSPIIENREARPPDEEVVTYTWPGVFRRFRVEVVVEDPDNPVVMDVNLLGSATELNVPGRKRKTAAF